MFLLIIIILLLHHHRVFVVFVMMGGGGGGGGNSIAIGIQGSVLVGSDMGIVAPLHYWVEDRCWRRGFKEQLTGHLGQICMQVMGRRSSGGSGAGGNSSSGAGGCGHGECTEREECCEKNSCVEKHCLDEVVKGYRKFGSKRSYHM